ncbi:hypothetical protein [Kocuria atrinae]|uniref:hypothetical protein n=1 Tax=Kocuria atrinae TaxID=592377 RepID=UPI001CB9D744|nr:hypothetical protein [Kocuria atrinae]
MGVLKVHMELANSLEAHFNNRMKKGRIGGLFRDISGEGLKYLGRSSESLKICFVPI